MKNLQLINQKPADIINKLQESNPELDDIFSKLEPIKQHFNGAVQKYQAALIYCLSKQYNFTGSQILEIGLGRGYSTSYIATAAPLAHITSLSVSSDELNDAKKNLRTNGIRNVHYKLLKSTEFYNDLHRFDMIFVDGDHKHVKDDLPYWHLIKPYGLFLFHDYCSLDSVKPQPVVYEVLNNFALEIGKRPDVLVVDDTLIGMAGWYKD